LAIEPFNHQTIQISMDKVTKRGGNSYSVRNKSIALNKAIARTVSYFIWALLLRFNSKNKVSLFQRYPLFLTAFPKGFWPLNPVFNVNGIQRKILLFISTLVTSLQ
jgi:hypothetical protein